MGKRIRIADTAPLRPASWTGLAGGSPVPVSTGAPGSRPRFVVERRRAKRGVESLFGGSKCAGRSVKRTLQPRHRYSGRAEPLMSRRRPCPSGPGPGSAWRVSSGYGRRHVHTVWFGTGEARLPQPASGKDQGYKPMVKTFGGQRESDGVVVPLIGVQHNAPGGKGPNFDHAHRVGKREGMTEVSWSNSPGKSLLAVADGPLVALPVKVRELQRALWAAAKQSSGRRFHALYDRICRGDVLWEAWERVRQNRGAAGVDRITLVAVEDYGVDRMLRELRRDLLSGRYRPAPARRVEIPKPRGGKRPLGIPTEAA